MRKSISLCVLLIGAGCGGGANGPAPLDAGVQTDTGVQTDAGTQSTTALRAGSSDRVQLVLDGNINNGKYTEIGPIKVVASNLTAFHPDPTIAEAERKVQTRAASMNADAVINVSVGDVKDCNFSRSCRTATGMAIKFRN